MDQLFDKCDVQMTYHHCYLSFHNYDDDDHNCVALCSAYDVDNIDDVQRNGMENDVDRNHLTR